MRPSYGACWLICWMKASSLAPTGFVLFQNSIKIIPSVSERKARILPSAINRRNRSRAFSVEIPIGSGKQMTLIEVVQELNRRLISIFLKDPAHGGRRPVYGATKKFQEDPYWRDCLCFFDYFHGDNGAGIGASHQTGWTGLVARLIRLSVGLDVQELLNREHKPGLSRNEGIQVSAAAATGD